MMDGAQNRAFEGDNVNLQMSSDNNHRDKSELTKQSISENFELDTENPADKPSLNKMSKFFNEHKRTIFGLKVVILNVLFGSYFAYATCHLIDLREHRYRFYRPSNGKNKTEIVQRCQGYCGMQWCDGYGMLLILTSFTYIALLYYQIIKPRYGRQIYESSLKPIHKILSAVFSNRLCILIALAVVLVILAIYLFFDTMESRERLRSLYGIAILFGIGFVFSKHIGQINWRPVICGLCVQFLLGIFCIRMEIGRQIFGCIGNKTAHFLNYAKEGSSFVYGDLLVLKEGAFAFAVLPVIFFFSFIISILYYWGAMQWTVRKLGWILQLLLGSTACESITAAGNIFLGMTESPLLIRPYVKHLTASEIHAVMSSGFATVSGTVLAAYISYGADPAHLITSSVMAAPGNLAFAKLFYPETEESKTTAENIAIEKSTDSSVLDAASNGANTAINLILGIIANLVAFVAFIAFLNGAVNWFGYLIGIDELTFEWLLAKLFTPLAYILGIPWEECEHVGTVIASKTIINEFVAYERLGRLKKAGLISLRSSAIATFAVCGFANPSSLGIMIGGLSSMSPDKKGVIASVALRAFITGSFVCFINASIAGLLMTKDIFNDMNKNATINF